MVAIVSSAPTTSVRARRVGWSASAAAAIVIGIAVRFAIGGAGVGERSAVVMSVLLTLLVWLAARMLRGPRVALLVTLLVTALLDIAALPPRNPPPYDNDEALYRTDQVVAATLPVTNNAGTAITLLVQPVFSGPAPHFGLAGDVNGSPYEWSCPFAQGIQRIALPVQVRDSSVDIRLHLTGSPSRDGDYLIVYEASREGGAIISIGKPDASATVCRSSP